MADPNNVQHLATVTIFVKVNRIPAANLHRALQHYFANLFVDDLSETLDNHAETEDFVDKVWIDFKIDTPQEDQNE